MKSFNKSSWVSTLGCAAGLMFAFSGQLSAQNPFGLDIDKAFERQMEQFSRLLPNDPAAKEQFDKALAEMKKAFQDGSPGSSEPQTFEFRWESDEPGDLSELQMEFERMGGAGGISGRDLFEQFFGSAPFGNGLSPQRLRGMHGFPMENLLDMEPPAPPEQSKNHPDELKKFESVVEPARPSTARILRGGNQLALATIVTEDGYALTKRSELGRAPGGFDAQLANGNTVGARFVESVDDYDLAVLKLDAKGLTAAQFTDSAALPLGSFLAAPDVTVEPAAAGVLSVQARNLSPKSKGYLGIAVAPGKAGVVVKEVTPDSAAAAAGIQPNDIITEIDGRAVASPPQLIKLVSGQEPDAIVEIDYIRNGRPAKASAKLQSRAELIRLGIPTDRSAFDLTSRMGADISRQHDGYPSAIQHDLPLDSNQMGGPLVDLDGNIVGINIARSGRVSTYALPAAELNKILESLKLEERSGKDGEENNRLPEVVEAGSTSALREEVERAELAIEEARAALRAAEEGARAAREALNRQR
ncbi:MAG: PDZ domain-containing protein [Verrucomicrobiales bacterium]